MYATQKSPERAFALQKYLLLHSQHDALQKHITHITTTPTASPTTSRSASLSSSPGSEPETSYLSSPPRSIPTHIPHHRRSGSMPRAAQRPAFRTRRSSLPTVIDESIIDEIEEDETKLKDVNLQIKSTLTELLNCESVRTDNRYRMWVQTRLHDAERELKQERTRSCDRRRSVDVRGSML